MGGTEMFQPELLSGGIARPSCGDPADWECDGSEIEVDCAECGRYPISAKQLDEAVDVYDEGKDR